MKRADVWWVDLSPRTGSEQRGERPAVVMSHDGFNMTPSWRSIIVVPLTTSTQQGGRGPTVVPIGIGASGLNQPSYALCHQVTTLDRSKFTHKLGALPSDAMRAIADALAVALDLP